jgi:hypothetical protein
MSKIFIDAPSTVASFMLADKNLFAMPLLAELARLPDSFARAVGRIN